MGTLGRIVPARGPLKEANKASKGTHFNSEKPCSKEFSF